MERTELNYNLEKLLNRFMRVEKGLDECFDEFWYYFTRKLQSLLSKLSRGELETDLELFEEKLDDLLINIKVDFSTCLKSFADSKLSYILNIDPDASLIQKDFSRSRISVFSKNFESNGNSNYYDLIDLLDMSESYIDKGNESNRNKKNVLSKSKYDFSLLSKEIEKDINQTHHHEGFNNKVDNLLEKFKINNKRSEESLKDVKPNGKIFNLKKVEDKYINQKFLKLLDQAEKKQKKEIEVSKKNVETRKNLDFAQKWKLNSKIYSDKLDFESEIQQNSESNSLEYNESSDTSNNDNMGFFKKTGFWENNNPMVANNNLKSSKVI